MCSSSCNTWVHARMVMVVVPCRSCIMLVSVARTASMFVRVTWGSDVFGWMIIYRRAPELRTINS